MNLRDVLTRAAEAGGAWDVDHVADLIERRTRLRVELTADHRVRVCDARGRRLYRADGGAFDIGDVVAQVAIEKPFLFHPTMEEEDAKRQGYHDNNSRPKQERGSRVTMPQP